MADIIGMDELETFVLDFLAYRRERRMAAPTPPNPVPKRIESKPEQPAPVEAGNIPFTIGKGWPHYRHIAKGSRRTGQDTVASMPNHGHNQAPLISASQNDIIPALAPVVAQVLSRFGPPTNPKSMDNLVNHVIASAMSLPPVSESIQTAEIKPWGKVALLQAVVELLIRISTM